MCFIFVFFLNEPHSRKLIFLPPFPLKTALLFAVWRLRLLKITRCSQRSSMRLPCTAATEVAAVFWKFLEQVQMHHSLLTHCYKSLLFIDSKSCFSYYGLVMRTRRLLSHVCLWSVKAELVHLKFWSCWRSLSPKKRTEQTVHLLFNQLLFNTSKQESTGVSKDINDGCILFTATIVWAIALTFVCLLRWEETDQFVKLHNHWLMICVQL